MARVNFAGQVVTGKANGYIYSTWKGIHYMKGYAIPSNPRTEAQQANRANFSLMTALATTMYKALYKGRIYEESNGELYRKFISQNSPYSSNLLQNWESLNWYHTDTFNAVEELAELDYYNNEYIFINVELTIFSKALDLDKLKFFIVLFDETAKRVYSWIDKPFNINEGDDYINFSAYGEEIYIQPEDFNKCVCAVFVFDDTHISQPFFCENIID